MLLTEKLLMIFGVIAVILICELLLIQNFLKKEPIISYSLEDPELSWNGWEELKSKLDMKILYLKYLLKE